MSNRVARRVLTLLGVVVGFSCLQFRSNRNFSTRAFLWGDFGLIAAAQNHSSQVDSIETLLLKLGNDEVVDQAEPFQIRYDSDVLALLPSMAPSSNNKNTVPSKVPTSKKMPIEQTSSIAVAIDNFFSKLDKSSQLKMKWLKEYLKWHHVQRSQFPDVQLLTNFQRPNLTILYMDPIEHRGGLADRMKGIGHVIKRCQEENQLLLLKWYEAPMDLEEFLVPTLFNWTLPDYGSLSTPEDLRNWAKLSTSAGWKVKLVPFSNQFGNYLAPFHHIWTVFFQPSAFLQTKITQTRKNLNLTTGGYDAVHLRIGHPAFAKEMETNHKTDYEGDNFSGESRRRAISKTARAFNCSQWLAPTVLPVYFLADSEELVQFVLHPVENQTANSPDELADIASLVHWTRRIHVVGRETAPVAHIDSNIPLGSSLLETHTSTFVDLYLASGSRCISAGVGRFAYLAGKISGSGCWARHQNPNKKISQRWGMSQMKEEIPACPR